ncbi:ubiquitin carboxyl-terminal hydrolase 16/45 [Onthophagus taurus]|uniref:ubiquitin carboxyl-terminal hydrolase 16/45 n=1 Tax=Onthophagus taurus TaxID=166361 RepID=UPI0039BEAB1A
MGRKKHQHEPNQNSGESTESYDENQNSTKCPHLNKAVDLTKIKKGLQKSGLRKDCEECTRNPIPHSLDIPEGMIFDDSLWLCLQCGNQACGRSVNKHALKHYNTPRSDNHTLCLNTSNWSVWCYKCDNEVNTTASKKLLEAVEYLKKNSEQGKVKQEKLVSVCNDDVVEDDVMMKLNPLLNPLSIKRTIGLRNLGNTCFFNAVIQCLSHTPYLLELLKETSMESQKFQLPGGKLIIDDTTLDLEPLEGNLEQWRQLAKALAETMEVLQNGEGEVFSPKNLLSKLTDRMPQFVIGEQHDSHELLRHLLEAVREEDSKRYQREILNKFGLSTKTIPSLVENEKRAVIKFYGQQASELLSPTEQVFRGILVSTLQCEDCSHTSHRDEFFLDLSLPIIEKQKPPRRKADEIEDKSKYQIKKEKRAAKKNKKNRGPKGIGGSFESNDSTGNAEERNSGWESDADVEDNLDENKTKDEKSILPALEFMGSPSGTIISNEMEVAENSSSSSEAEIKLTNSSQDNNDKKEFERPESRLSFVHNSKGDLKEDLEKLLLNDGDSQKVDNVFVKDAEVGVEGAACMDEVDDDQKMDEDEDDSDMWMETMAPRYQCEEGECSVQSCLNQFTACELMTSNNKVSCELCTKRHGGADKKTVYTNAHKQLLIYNPPAVLILHLKRFQVYHYRPTKVSKHVAFPMVLDLAPYLSKRSQGLSTFETGQTQVLYSLYGVVEHSGTMHGGHYVAYVKVRPKLEPNSYRWQFLPKNQKQTKSDEVRGAHGIPQTPPGKWYHVSDSYVAEVQETSVLRAQAYLLFYERIY